MGDGAVLAAVDLIRVGVDALLECDLSSLSGVQVAAALAAVEVERRRGESVDQRLLAEAGERGLAGEYACASTAGLLVELLRVSPREAKARVARARDMGPRRAVTGQPLAPVLPLVAAAQRAGAISGEHAGVIVRAVDKIPGELAGEFAGIVEAALVEQARHVHPGQVAEAGERLLARIDQDGAAPREAERQRRRDFGIRMTPDGTGIPYGRFTPGLCAVWHPVLDALTAPQPAAPTAQTGDIEVGSGLVGSGEVGSGEVGSGEVGERDDRTPGQRRHDALLEAGQRLLRSGDLPDSGGVPVTIIAHLSASQLDEHLHAQTSGARTGAGPNGAGPSSTGPSSAGPNGTGPGGTTRTGHGDLIDIAELLRLAAEAQLIPVVLNDAGGVLSYGQRRRLASCGQRLALTARDRGCSFPGCTRPPSWCQAHHVTPWHLGGPTDLANLCLLCSFHHREFERRGWHVQMTDGTPEWIPPPWLDPCQRPRRNTAHHVDIDFDDTHFDDTHFDTVPSQPD